MKRFISFITLVFIFSLAFAQTKTAVYQGREVKVFPYRVNYNSNYVLDEYSLGDYNIPFCPEKLEDGEYIIYHTTFYSFEKMSLDSLGIYANFKIINGLKEGEVKFYSTANQLTPTATGYYKNDLKSGVWAIDKKEVLYVKVHEKKLEKRKRHETLVANYKEGKLDGKLITEDFIKREREVANYSEGQYNGRVEKYINNKLRTFDTYKNGEHYGEYKGYIEYTNNRSVMIDGNPVKQIPITGFKLGNYYDSFKHIYNKNKVRFSYLNSDVPFVKLDSMKSGYWVDFSHFVSYLKFFGSYYYSFNSRKKYKNIYETNSNGKRFNDIYLVNSKIQLPFAFVNRDGDTILKAEGLEETKAYVKYRTTQFEYGKKGKLISKTISTHHYAHFYDTAKKTMLPVPYYQKLESKISYEGNKIIKIFELNTYEPGSKNWLRKLDSIAILNRKTGKFVQGECRYFITKIYNKNLKIKITIDKKGNPIVWKNFDFKLNNDTIKLMEKKEIADSLYMVYTYYINTKDSLVYQPGDTNIINPHKAVYAQFTEFGNYTGLAGYTVEYKGKPYSGKLKIETTYTNNQKLACKKPKIKYIANEKVILEGVFLHESESIRIKNCVYSPYKYHTINDVYLKIYESNSSDKLQRFEYNFKDGLIDGTQKLWMGENNIYDLHFYNGISHLYQKFRSNSSFNLLDNYSERMYNRGIIDGVIFTTNESKQPLMIAKYKDGKLNGNYTQFEDPFKSSIPNSTLAYEASFKNDTLINDVVTYKHGEEFERIPFEKGKVTGTYLKYFQPHISYHTLDNYLVKENKQMDFMIKFKNGMIQDTIIGFYTDGGIKFKAVKYDTIKTEVLATGYYNFKQNHGIYGNTWLNEKPLIADTNCLNNIRMNYAPCIIINPKKGEPFSPYIVFNEAISNTLGRELKPEENMNLDMIYFYKNGIKSQQGKIKDGSRIGVWKYWSENGILMKEIEYQEDKFIDVEEPFEFYGKITSYRPNGKKLYDGLIVNEEINYQCDQELEVAYQEVFYLNCYDELGNQTLLNRTGFVSDYYLNGNKRYTGQITNGLKSGLWKYYDSNGNLKEIGEYVDDQKHGKWLEGDLGGVNFLDNACSVNEALELMKERQQKDIDVTEFLYEMGEVISQSHLVLEKF